MQNCRNSAWTCHVSLLPQEAWETPHKTGISLSWLTVIPTAASCWRLVVQWVTQVLPCLPALPAPSAVLAVLHSSVKQGCGQCTGAGWSTCTEVSHPLSWANAGYLFSFLLSNEDLVVRAPHKSLQLLSLLLLLRVWVTCQWFCSAL